MQLIASIQDGISKSITFVKSRGVWYQQLPLTEEKQQFLSSSKASSESESRFEPPPPLIRKSVLAKVFLTIVYFTTFLILLVYIIHPPPHYHRMDASKQELDFQGGTRTIEYCGSSVQEAQSRGCIWDLMSFRWVHPACYNRNESEAWLSRHGPWKWYLDHNDTSTELQEESLPYESRVWTQQGYHVAHCLYIWKLLHLAGMRGSLVDDEGIEIAHSDHCAMMLLKKDHVPFEKVVTRVDVLFGKCVTMY